MAYQATFQRYESKYLLTRQQKHVILQEMQPHMRLDAYGRTTTRNMYYDTPDYRLIRRSLEKPVYKEKLRIRSYQKAAPSDPVFVELKKKYQSIVYKRRLTLPEAQVMHSFQTGQPLPVQSQIAEEIAYFRTHYQKLKPSVFLSYEREAFYALDGSGFRVTFDENILYRQRDFSLGSAIYGTPILSCGQTLMEIKCAGGLPLWMCSALAIGWILAGFYMYRAKYTKSFVVTLVLLPAVVCVVIMMVNGNVGTGVAVAGAFSLVRFRSVPGSAKEIGAIFLAMGTGLIVGMGYIGYAFLCAVLLGAVSAWLNGMNFGAKKQAALYKTLRSAGEEKQMIDKLRCRNGNLEISISNQETNTSML